MQTIDENVATVSDFLKKFKPEQVVFLMTFVEIAANPQSHNRFGVGGVNGGDLKILFDSVDKLADSEKRFGWMSAAAVGFLGEFLTQNEKANAEEVIAHCYETIHPDPSKEE